MGSLIKIWKTLPMPNGAKIGRNGTVTWLAKGKKKTGKLSTIRAGQHRRRRCPYRHRGEYDCRLFDGLARAEVAVHLLSG